MGVDKRRCTVSYYSSRPIILFLTSNRRTLRRPAGWIHVGTAGFYLWSGQFFALNDCASVMMSSGTKAVLALHIYLLCRVKYVLKNVAIYTVSQKRLGFWRPVICKNKYYFLRFLSAAADGTRHRWSKLADYNGKWPKRPTRMSKTAHVTSPKRPLFGRFGWPKRPTQRSKMARPKQKWPKRPKSKMACGDVKNVITDNFFYKF